VSDNIEGGSGSTISIAEDDEILPIK